MVGPTIADRTCSTPDSRSALARAAFKNRVAAALSNVLFSAACGVRLGKQENNLAYAGKRVAAGQYLGFQLVEPSLSSLSAFQVRYAQRGSLDQLPEF
jgi:hypothetical protein